MYVYNYIYVCVCDHMCIYLFISDKIMNMWKAQCHKPTIWECLIKYVFMILGMFYYWFDHTINQINQTTAEWRNEEQQKTYGFSKQHC